MSLADAYDNLASMMRPDNLLTYGQRVVEWNNVAARAKGSTTPLEKQMGFIKEEFDELITASKENDQVEIVDAACDLFVVSSYALAIKASINSTSWRNTLLYSKGERFDIGEMMSLLYGYNPESESVRQKILEMVIGLCYSLDTNLRYNMLQVLDSNDSKYPYASQIESHHPGTTLEEALRRECVAIEKRSEGRYKDIYAKQVQDLATPDVSPRIVFFDSNGKIMKPCTFVEPKIIV